jgi:prepilin-type N-terminal cleavage/methylation domain-containing protein
MLWRWCVSSRATHGFSLVELMIAVAIISILAIIAIPNYAAHRHKSLVAAVVGTAGGIRAALASYASDSSQARFPLTTDIAGWETLRTIVNTHGSNLRNTSTEMGIETIDYTSEDGTTYLLHIIVNVPQGILGRTVAVTPGSIAKQ